MYWIHSTFCEWNNIAMQHTSDESSSLAHYYNFLVENRNYRLYLFSHMCQHAGDWFVRIAALISVQRITDGSSTALAIVVMCR